MRPVYFELLPAGVLLVLASCSDLPTGPADTPTMRTRAITLVDWTPDGYASAAARSAVDAIAASGANTLFVITTVYQDNATGFPAFLPSRTPTNVALTAIIQYAQQAGLRVGLKPHVDLLDGAWRGTIGPADANAWFGAYASVLDGYADLAQTLDIDVLVVGTELAGTVAHDARWRDVIAGVRGRFGGELTYAASWDEVQMVAFWDALDLLGVDLYAPVATRENPERFELLRGWQPWIARLDGQRQSVGKRVLITEVGYRSVDGAGQKPYEFGNDARVDLGEQADLYWAALTALGDKDWIEGVVWWNWPARGVPAADDTDYRPDGKPAEGELRDAWNG